MLPAYCTQIDTLTCLSVEGLSWAAWAECMALVGHFVVGWVDWWSFIIKWIHSKMSFATWQPFSSGLNDELIEAWIKWLSCCRWHFWIHLFNENYYVVVEISLKYVPKGPVKLLSQALVQLVAQWQTGSKSSLEPLMTQFTSGLNVLSNESVPVW